MSKIGKKPLVIPQGVEVDLKETAVQVKGPKGTLDLNLPYGVKIEKNTIYNNSYDIVLWINNICGINFKCHEQSK